MRTVVLKTPVELFERKPMIVFSEEKNLVNVDVEDLGVTITKHGCPAHWVLTPWHNVISVRSDNGR